MRVVKLCIPHNSMKIKQLMQTGILMTALNGTFVQAQEVNVYNNIPSLHESWDECRFTMQKTDFSLWAPEASKVKLTVYNYGKGNEVYMSKLMKPEKNGMWKTSVKENIQNKFYTFNVEVDGKWLGENPGIKALAVNVNGTRGAIIDLAATNPRGWENDPRPALKSFADIIIYEMHHRDFSISASSGINHKGKFLALTETGTKNSEGRATGIDHLKELGITHVHILPSYDYASIDETHLEQNKYNWGYDPLNYNVPDGSYSTDPYTPQTRIREFKEMVQALHKAGIRVVLDVVYNHTFNIEGSNFQRTAPDYFFRKRPDGTYGNGSGCNNETASERPMMRRFMIESVLYWAKEYHLDGFRFDLMGVHDIETMNEIRNTLNKLDPSIFIYGEGWAAEHPQLPDSLLAMKANTQKMPGIAAFGDELRDAIRGPFNDDHKPAFLAGLPGNVMSIKFGIVGAISHPQVINDSVNYSKAPWALQPTQAISYVSCHDDMCLADRLKASLPESTERERLALDKLAQTIVFTSQGVPFMLSGEELFRDKKGVHNSFESPDSINALNWDNKSQYKDLFSYYKQLIGLRKAHPAFRMGNAEQIRQHLVFLPTESDKVIAYTLNNHANEDEAEQIVVIFNAGKNNAALKIDSGNYKILCVNGEISTAGFGYMEGGNITVSGQSALILCK